MSGSLLKMRDGYMGFIVLFLLIFFTYLKFSTIKSKKKKANLNNVLLVHRKKDRKTNKKTKGGKGEREK